MLNWAENTCQRKTLLLFSLQLTKTFNSIGNSLYLECWISTLQERRKSFITLSPRQWLRPCFASWAAWPNWWKSRTGFGGRRPGCRDGRCWCRCLQRKETLKDWLLTRAIVQLIMSLRYCNTWCHCCLREWFGTFNLSLLDESLTTITRGHILVMCDPSMNLLYVTKTHRDQCIGLSRSLTACSY